MTLPASWWLRPRWLWRISTRPRRLDVVRSWWAFWRVYMKLAKKHGEYWPVDAYEAAAGWVSRVDQCMEPEDADVVALFARWFGPPEQESYAECLAARLQVWLEDTNLIAEMARYYDGE